MTLGKTKSYSSDEFIKILRKNGYHFVRQNGSHLVYEKDGDHIVITKKNINKMICRRLLKQHNLVF